MYYVRTANKYGAKRTEFNGRKYDSKHEAGIAGELELLRRAGQVIKIEPMERMKVESVLIAQTSLLPFGMNTRKYGKPKDFQLLPGSSS
jgi:hypothetical protein